MRISGAKRAPRGGGDGRWGRRPGAVSRGVERRGCGKAESCHPPGLSHSASPLRSPKRRRAGAHCAKDFVPTLTVSWAEMGSAQIAHNCVHLGASVAGAPGAWLRFGLGWSIELDEWSAAAAAAACLVRREAGTHTPELGSGAPCAVSNAGLSSRTGPRSADRAGPTPGPRHRTGMPRAATAPADTPRVATHRPATARSARR